MKESGSFIPGSACWIDVTTIEPAGSRDFYAGLFGWTYQTDPTPHRGHYTRGHTRDHYTRGHHITGSYATALLGGRPVAGLAGCTTSTRQLATWRLYLNSANVTYVAEMINQWGGQVCYGPKAVHGRGSMLIGTDPTGAEIGFWQLPATWAFHTAAPGSLVWADLHTWDGHRANRFFATLFGYRQRQIGNGCTVDYTIWSLGSYTMLGRLQMNRDWPVDTPPHWMLYFAVDPATGTDHAADRVLALGGQLHVDPVDSQFGRIAVVQDPCGATFSLVDPTRRVGRETGVTANDDPYDD